MAIPAETIIVTCPSCGARNRLRQVGAAGKEPVCGKCHKPLPASGAKPVIVTDENFRDIVAASPMPVLLDLWAAWCGPCRLIAPTIEQLAAELDGRVLIAKLDVDANPRTSTRFGVQSIPTLLILKDGREVDRLIGVQPKSNILQRLQRFI
jgi:thioredoxin 2